MTKHKTRAIMLIFAACVILSTSTMTDAATISYNFDGPSEQGWTDVLTSVAANANTDYDAVTSGWGRNPQAGDGWIAPNTSGASGWNQRDGNNTAFVLRSPAFVLDNSGDLTFYLQGGVSGGALPSNFSGLGGTGFMGLALRDDSNGDYVIGKGRPTSGDGYTQVSFTAAELTTYVGGTYTLDLIDDKQGGWGWGGVDTISIPGTPIPEPSTITLVALGLISLGTRRRRKK